MENDEDTANAVVDDVERFARGVEQLEFQRMFSGKMDSHSAFVDIQAGAGGTEAQDWARNAAAHVPALGRVARLEDRTAGSQRRRRRRHQVGARSASKAITPTAG